MPVTSCFSTISSSSQMSVPGGLSQIAHAGRVRVVEGGAHEGAHPVHHGELDRAHLQHLGAERGHFEHFLERHLGEPPRLRHDARVGRIDAVDVGIDVAAVGADRRRDRDRAGVGAAAAERRDAVVRRRAPGSRRSPPPGPRRSARSGTPPSMSVMRAAPCAASVRIGICQPCQERALMPIVLQHDGEQPGRHLLAGGDDGVVFARVVQRRGRARPARPARWSCRPWPRRRRRPRGRHRPRA